MARDATRCAGAGHGLHALQTHVKTTSPDAYVQTPPRSINLATPDFLVMNGTARGRRSVERQLDARRIPKTHPMALHDRIERIKDSQPNAHAALMAIKSLGNAGSHTDELSRDDLFNAFDLGAGLA
jgi:hypothetical protein